MLEIWWVKTLFVKFTEQLNSDKKKYTEVTRGMFVWPKRFIYFLLIVEAYNFQSGLQNVTYFNTLSSYSYPH